MTAFLQIQHIRLCRGEKTIFAEYQQQFTAPRTCLLAPNGAGKSSLLCAIAGLIPLHGGQILFNGSAIRQPETRVALASDSVQLPHFLTAGALLQLQQQLWHLPEPTSLISRFDFSAQLAQRIGDLSAGNLKKLTLIAALMRQAPLLLLDEPNIALDEAAQHTLWQCIDHYPGQIIAASHEADLFAQHHFARVPLHGSLTDAQ